MSTVDMKSALLAEAETLVRTVGYTAFSYADLSERVGIRKASIHHHFPTKEALGNALIDAYLVRFTVELERLSDRRLDTRGKLAAYGEFFAGGLRDGLMPLCGALAAGSADLPVSMQKRVERFFKTHLAWLEKELRAGLARGDVRPDLKPDRAAVLMLSTLQGASLVAWALKDAGAIKAPLRDIVESLTV
ncbi:TetR/AcrR family transcriptional regulator [Hyphomicrobium sp. CS1GBMeth3]|uniref:TetR/AcrR family transcriptional regulator n=1 Tax=Hyphomicrobium sp. CS1GBMeth3 TaxID=1892845 RepID=UPI000930672A|nr:TetR/AcrR family transcriptional regulator [Hyphomicrobium sp. CS1GBMeth3]